MKKFFDFCTDFDFYLKVAISCAIFQQVFYGVLSEIHLNIITQAVLLWAVGFVAYYPIGFVIEKLIKGNHELKEKRNVRVKQVKKQPFPPFTAKEIVGREAKSFIIVLVVIFIAPEVHRENNFLVNFSWFLMWIVATDLCFYLSHRLLHSQFLIKFHRQHHEFIDSSSFVADYNSWVEYIIVAFADFFPVFIFGYDIHQLLAWVLIANIYDLEVHSSLSLFFISSNCHDLHHTCSALGNYSIHGFWDRIFNTLNPVNPVTKKPGIMFPLTYLENSVKNQSQS